MDSKRKLGWNMRQAKAYEEATDLTIARREAGKWLRDKRDALHITQRQLANAVGIEYYTFISQIEQGRGRIPPDRYEVWAKALKVDPREFAITMLKYNEPHIYELIFGRVPVEEVKTGDYELRLARLEAALSKNV